VRYTEAKQVLMVLKENGWFKLKGIPGEYRKYWIVIYEGQNHQYAQMIRFEELRYAMAPTEEILEFYERRARDVFEERFKIPLESAGNIFMGKILMGTYKPLEPGRRW
jgi:hypothetical protein